LATEPKLHSPRLVWPLAPLTLTKRGKEIDYEAKTVKLAGRRYIVCRNHQ
jgi:hypothetical protein